MFGLSSIGIKAIVIGLIVAAILGYIAVLKIEVNHYKGKAVSVQVAFDAYRISEEGMQAALKSAAAAQTLTAKQNLITALQAVEAKNQAIKSRIANDEASKTIVIPASSLRVLNDSSAIGRNPGGSADSVGGDVSSTSAPETSNEVLTLQDLEATVADNNAEHWNCIKVIQAWQSFWKEFSENVSRVAKHASP